MDTQVHLGTKNKKFKIHYRLCDKERISKPKMLGCIEEQYVEETTIY